MRLLAETTSFQPPLSEEMEEVIYRTAKYVKCVAMNLISNNFSVKIHEVFLHGLKPKVENCIKSMKMNMQYRCLCKQLLHNVWLRV